MRTWFRLKIGGGGFCGGNGLSLPYSFTFVSFVLSRIMLVGLSAVRQHVRGRQSIYEEKRLVTWNKVVGAAVMLTKHL